MQCCSYASIVALVSVNLMCFFTCSELSLQLASTLSVFDSRLQRLHACEPCRFMERFTGTEKLPSHGGTSIVKSGRYYVLAKEWFIFVQPL